jgi:complex III assembly factor LYRM7
MAALEAYRHLLRSTRIAFQGTVPLPRLHHHSPTNPLSLGDARLLTAARREARKGFDTSRYLSETDAAVTAGIAHANDVARILRQNVVQGKQVDNGDDDVASYSMSFPLCHL